MTNLNRILIGATALVGLGIGSLVNGGCVTAPIGGRAPRSIQWMEVDGNMGYINDQGYFMSPQKGGYKVYEYSGGGWHGIGDKVKYITYRAWSSGTDPDTVVILK